MIDQRLGSPHGYLRIDDLFVDVYSLRPVRAGIELRAVVYGPIATEHAGPIRWFTPDHEPVTEQANGQAFVATIPADDVSHARVEVVYTLHIEELRPRMASA